jgi:hypothetical protein
MSLIPDRYECPTCGGYDVPHATSLSSACRCGQSIYGDRSDDEERVDYVSLRDIARLSAQDSNVND